MRELVCYELRMKFSEKNLRRNGILLLLVAVVVLSEYPTRCNCYSLQFVYFAAINSKH